MKLKQLLDKRASVWEQMKTDLAEIDTDGFNDERRQAYAAKEAELEELTKDIDALTRSEELKKRMEEVESPDPAAAPPTEPRAGDPPTPEDEYRAAFGSWMRRGVQGVSAEHREVLQAKFVAGEELRAQGVTTDAAGGYLVPEDFRNTMTETKKFFGGMLENAEIIETTTGADLPWPTNDDTAQKGEQLAENTAATEQDLVLGQKKLGAYTYSSKIVRVSLQLLQDSAFDLDNWVPKKQGERIARIQNEKFTVGTGTNEPQGIVTGAGVGKTGATGQTLTVTYDDIIDLEHSVDVAYRNERAAFMFHDLSLAKLRKLKDGDQRPLWVPTIVAGAPDTFNGKRYVVNNDMAQMAANAKSILFGDFKAAYVIRIVKSFQLLRLSERYAEFLQVGFLGFERADGLVQDAAAVKAYQNSAT